MRRPIIELSAVTWRKSSYSNQDGGQCLEISDDFLTAADWFKSSHSNQDGGECVEIAANLPAVVPVRDSKTPDGPVLVFPAGDWSAFVTAVKKGSLPS
ncbi:DUF397 domain-containing protein [Streptomyces tsukubensis]|uniref:DUF397 domain-containing protein n=1 Tax=Streptomyces tsukubensis TaxID=83656 RepID=UPI00369052A1